jgi:predicted DNA-binding protein
MADQTTLYVDQETKERIDAIAAREGRSKIETLRRMTEQYLGNLGPLDLAMLHQIAKDEGLSSLIEAIGHVIHDWQRLKHAALPPRPHAPAVHVPAPEV